MVLKTSQQLNNEIGFSRPPVWRRISTPICCFYLKNSSNLLTCWGVLARNTLEYPSRFADEHVRMDDRGCVRFKGLTRYIPVTIPDVTNTVLVDPHFLTIRHVLKDFVALRIWTYATRRALLRLAVPRSGAYRCMIWQTIESMINTPLLTSDEVQGSQTIPRIVYFTAFTPFPADTISWTRRAAFTILIAQSVYQSYVSF